MVLESGHPTLELNHAPGPEHREGHLIPGAELGPALPHLLEVPNGETVGYLRINPLWDPLRKDPRFVKFLAAPQSK